MQKNKLVSPVLPGQTIGIIGGGQLGRMMAISARYMGYKVIVLDPTPNCPTAQVADQQIVAPYDDLEAVRKLVNLADVVTYEFENVDLEAARFIEEEGKLPQGSLALEITQNRKEEKEFLHRLNLPVPSFEFVTNAEQCKEALEEIPLPAVIKTCRGGYDGKGQLKIETEKDFPKAYQFAEENRNCIVEAWITFEREISTIFTKGIDGQFEIYPLAENYHENHILSETTVPASVSKVVYEKVIAATKTIANALDTVGTFAIEMFVKNDEIFMNEMAPRPHNSGHYTIEACNISQFTQHIRAICQLPLVPVKLKKPAKMINLLGKDLEHAFQKMKIDENAFVHLYGKSESRPDRKMGHVTFIAETVEEVERQVNKWKKL